MQTIILVIHLMIAVALVGSVLLQKSEGGALGIGGGGGMSGFMTGRSTANLLTRTTAILAALFFATSILLVVFSNATRAPRSIIDQGGGSPLTAPVIPGAPTVPVPTSPSVPAQPAQPAPPAAPLAK